MAGGWIETGPAPKVTPLAHAGAGLLNDPKNDVWVAVGKTSFFVDGEEWEVVLRYLTSRGQGSIVSLRPQVAELAKLNADVQSTRKIWIVVLCIGAGVAALLFFGRKRS